MNDNFVGDNDVVNVLVVSWVPLKVVNDVVKVAVVVVVLGLLNNALISFWTVDWKGNKVSSEA